ncbi:MAG: hypothetical protein ACHBNF_15965 [Chromatiales bacterium]
MAKVQGVKEKLHSPLYDAFLVPPDPAKTFKDFMTDPRMIRFFVDVQNKTRLETNLQASGVLPSLNTFEARAMRVIASTFCLPIEALSILRKAIIDAANAYRIAAPFPETKGDIPPPVDPAAPAAQGLINEIRRTFATVIGTASVNGHLNQAILDEGNEYRNALPLATVDNTPPAVPIPAVQDTLVTGILSAFEAGCRAAGGVLPALIYNSVTTLLVGEKIMIESPTFYFPSGAGVSPGGAEVTNHGEPDPMATFRFSEPVTIDPQQNFRVEMLFPQGVPGLLANTAGPLRIWVVLDGYLTRDVQ